ncbi:histone deacetylase 5 isoform X2 [Neltuma alba]|uniref:histone deacetylase 5 isoform X2 n=1 Tax=Neltuma alba TaxID=207710 RepID=UPI0010A3B164|nr:histone deacetylase 5-like isoform X2 [Prosopis alba]
MDAAVVELDSESKSNSIGSHGQRRVGLLYDERMCKHYTPDNDYHPENPDRIRAIWKKLQNAGIPERCVVLDAKEAEDRYLLSVHSKNHVKLIKKISSKQFNSRRNRIASKLSSIYFNEGSSEAAYLAAGSVVEVVEKVAKGELNSAVAIVRPPGHHAEHDEAMGFCLFNNVAVASSYLLDERPELGVKKILIVDWDVHHGNGTQKTFWNDSRVLFFSVHRHEFGSFYPANDDGFYTMIGEGPGAGFNVNVPWENGRCGDADYLAVWDHILVPVAKEFNPDIIIVSAGFDAAVGDPLGGCRVTPYGYSVMLEKLMNFAQGSSEAYPFESTWHVIQAVRQQLSPFWPTLASKLPETLICQIAPPPHTLISSSESETEDDKGPKISENLEELLQGVIEPLSKLNVDIDSRDQPTSATYSWRSELSNIFIWYASYGLNMWQSRFLCYIAGGKVEGMQMQCSGAMDTKPPREILWKTFPCRLFFGRDSSYTWGPGALALLNPETSNEDNTYMCLYKISLEQLNDLLLLENGRSQNIGSPLFDATALNVTTSKEFDSLEVIEGAWYGNVVYLGKEQNIPILTVTCSLSNIESFKSGRLPLRAPNKAYANTLIRGLVEGGQLSEAEAIAYIDAASAKPL